MKYLVDSREMQKYDANTISHFKVPGLLLMERAAIAFVEELHRQNVDLTEVLIVCGSGNNGGDGLAIARLLFLEGHAVTVVYAGNKRALFGVKQGTAGYFKCIRYFYIHGYPGKDKTYSCNRRNIWCGTLKRCDR